MSELDAFLDRDAFGSPADLIQGHRLGVVVGGSLSKGLEVKVARGAEIEELAVGRYVVVHGRRKKFFSMITDIALAHTNPMIQTMPPDLSDPFLADVYTGTAVYGTIHIAPMLALDAEEDAPRPVKTVPSHFTPVYRATEEDVNNVFGEEDAGHFHVGSPLELEDTQINIDLKRLTERSIGIFGKSGTGKSYLTRIVLAGTIKNGAAVSLIFDMHNDYGWEVINEDGRRDKGLKQLFDQKVVILTLDEDSSRRRNAKYDRVVTIGYTQIEPEDLVALKQTLDLSDSMLDAAYSLHKRWGETWILDLLRATPDEIEEVLATSSINPGSLTALSRRLERFDRFGFLKEQAPENTIGQIMGYLESGISVVLEFGRYQNSLDAYMLVANFITRRIHENYVKRIEKALGDKGHEPPQLLITIEEAHKFLDPAVANQTTFGIIAREMRKFKVTLLVVDQRPSAIDEEVMSQIGTRITALLDNERDIAAVLTGISGAGSLREVLARLDTRQQAIIMGHAVPMPVVIQTRSWDEEIYASLTGTALGNDKAAKDRIGRGSKPGRL